MGAGLSVVIDKLKTNKNAQGSAIALALVVAFLLKKMVKAQRMLPYKTRVVRKNIRAYQLVREASRAGLVRLDNTTIYILETDARALARISDSVVERCIAAKPSLSDSPRRAFRTDRLSCQALGLAGRTEGTSGSPKVSPD
jgi:hypothetical protein